MLTTWLQPIAEKKYIRLLYVGKIQLITNRGRNSKGKPTLEAILKDIWKIASKFNRRNFISGHLSCSRTLHVVQLLEGKRNVVMKLMERIRRDPRVVVQKEFVKEQLSMHLGWDLSMSYSFEITPDQLGLIQNTDLTMDYMFDTMMDTYQAAKDDYNLPSFYKEIVETILLKFIAVTKGEKDKREMLEN